MHSVYYWGRSPSPDNRVYVKVGDHRGDCTPEMVSEAVQKYKSSTGFDCQKGSYFVIILLQYFLISFINLSLFVFIFLLIGPIVCMYLIIY